MCSVRSGTDTTTELSGSDVICPDKSGIFECKATNTGLLVWRVSDTALIFPGSHTVNDSSIRVSGNVATLVDLNLTNGVVGDRTSILRVPPKTDSATITIICTGGDPVATCTNDVLFKGNATLYHVRVLVKMTSKPQNKHLCSRNRPSYFSKLLNRCG